MFNNLLLKGLFLVYNFLLKIFLLNKDLDLPYSLGLKFHFVKVGSLQSGV
jgi:hypothetical protein